MECKKKIVTKDVFFETENIYLILD